MKTYKGLIKERVLKVAETNVSFQKKKIGNSKDCEEYSRQFYFDDIEIYESFFILLLNRQNNTIAYSKISQGGVAGTVVDIKIIMKYAVDCLACGVVLVHNHPSGNLRPSTQDIEITEKIRGALKLLDMTLIDHLILTKNEYYSFADEGTL